MLERGIRPMATLYHWDLPQDLDGGAGSGWLGRDVTDRFADYATVVAQALKNIVPAFLTLNEPQCAAFLGYATGEHAPGRIQDGLAYPAAHHLNLAHGKGVLALRAVLPATAEVAVTLNVHQVEPASDSDADLAAAAHVDAVANRIFLDPMLRGSYPADLLTGTRHLTDWTYVRDGDLETIHQPVDFLGVNYYNPAWVGASGERAWAGTDAVAQGVDVRGYYVWSFLDNFEWAWGYEKRFGIVHVDFETQVRTPKDSARWYRDVIARGGL